MALSSSLAVSLLCNLLGAALLLHSAYSCLHYRNLVNELDLPSDSDTADSIRIPPLDVILECVGAFLLLLVGQLCKAGSLVPVVVETRKQQQTETASSLMAPSYKTRDFDIYSNRAHVLCKQ